MHTILPTKIKHFMKIEIKVTVDTESQEDRQTIEELIALLQKLARQINQER